MDSLLHLFKKKNTQQFIAFIFILLTLWLIAYPLVSEKTASTNEYKLYYTDNFKRKK